MVFRTVEDLVTLLTFCQIVLAPAEEAVVNHLFEKIISETKMLKLQIASLPANEIYAKVISTSGLSRELFYAFLYSGNSLVCQTKEHLDVKDDSR